MKKLSLILLMLPFIVKSQTNQINGFMGVDFGTSKDSIKNYFIKRGAICIDTTSSIGNVILIKNIEFSGKKPIYMYVALDSKNELYKGVCVFYPKFKPQAFEYYKEILMPLTEKYGKSIALKKFKSPYYEGDGYEVSALEKGYVTSYKDYWVNKSKNENKVIELSIDHNFAIQLTYIDFNRQESIKSKVPNDF